MKTIIISVFVFIIAGAGAGYAVKDQKVPFLSIIGQDISAKIIGETLGVIETTDEENLELISENSNLPTSNIKDTLALSLNSNSNQVLSAGDSELGNGFLGNSQLPNDIICSVGINNTYVVCTSFRESMDYFRSLPVYPEELLNKDLETLIYHDIPILQIEDIENRYNGSFSEMRIGNYFEVEMELINANVGYFDINFEEKKSLVIPDKKPINTQEKTKEVTADNVRSKKICSDYECFLENLISCTPVVVEFYIEDIYDTRIEIIKDKDNFCKVITYGFNSESPFDQMVSTCLLNQAIDIEQQIELMTTDENFFKLNCSQRSLTDIEFSTSKSIPKRQITKSCGEGKFGDIFIDKFSNCSEFSCEMRIPGFDELGQRNIIGYENNKCITEEITNGPAIKCKYSEDQLAKMTESYQILQAGGSIIDTEYFFYEALADGACSNS
jgi:hypothetical protein